MDLLQLRYFAEVAKVQNISLTAKQLYISQPALSTAIARLERDIGFPLFQRSSNSITLTEAGRCFLASVNSALTELDEGVGKAKQIASRDSGRLRLASSMGMIRTLAEEYQAGHDALQLEVEICDTDEVAARLLGGQADLGINLGPIHNSQFLNRTLMESQYFVIVNPTHPLAQLSAVRMKQLEGELLLCSNIAHTYEVAKSILKKANCNCNLLRLDEKEVLFEAARKGLGAVFCLPMISEDNPIFQADQDNHLVPLPIVDCAQTGQVTLISRKDGYFSSEAEQFMMELTRKFYHIERCTQQFCDALAN
jgi:DNA-binding transcriptional LysR family regulator